ADHGDRGAVALVVGRPRAAHDGRAAGGNDRLRTVDRDSGVDVARRDVERVQVRAPARRGDLDGVLGGGRGAVEEGGAGLRVVVRAGDVVTVEPGARRARHVDRDLVTRP